MLHHSPAGHLFSASQTIKNGNGNGLKKRQKREWKWPQKPLKTGMEMGNSQHSQKKVLKLSTQKIQTGRELQEPHICLERLEDVRYQYWPQKNISFHPYYSQILLLFKEEAVIFSSRHCKLKYYTFHSNNWLRVWWANNENWEWWGPVNTLVLFLSWWRGCQFHVSSLLM